MCAQTHTHKHTFQLARADGRALRCVCAGAFRRRVTPLHWAAENGRAAVAAALLAHGANVDAKTNMYGCVLPVVCLLTHTDMGGRLSCVCTGATFCACGVARACAHSWVRAHADRAPPADR